MLAYDASAPAARIKPTLDEAIEQGRGIARELGALPAPDANVEDIEEWRARMRDRMSSEVGRSKTANVQGHGRAAELVRSASSLYPQSWVNDANNFGPLTARYDKGRGFYRPSGNAGEIHCDSCTVAVHEYGHRVQYANRELDDYFQELHARRTAGEAPRPLRELDPARRYQPDEMAQKDKYADAYFGKIYGGIAHGRRDAREVIPMIFQGLLARGYEDRDQRLMRKMVREDPELLYLGLGLLFGYAP